MADAQAKKLTEEIAKLELEQKSVEGATTTLEACKKVIEYCNSTPDPFFGDSDSTNIWLASAKSGGGCSIA